VLIAVREGEESPLLAAGLPDLVLGGLDQKAAAELLESSGAGHVSAEMTGRLVAATGGNPLALLELGPEAQRAPSGPDHNLPVATSVERAYLRRAAGLSDAARKVLLLVAAAGPGHDSEAAGAREAAARRARESSGYAAAAAAWVESARLTADDATRAERFFQAADNAWLGGRAEDAEESLKSARKLAREGL